MKQLLITLLTIGAAASTYAHCPLELSIQGETYCTDLEWQMAQKKTNGTYVETEELSPSLIKKGTIPPLWLYSQAQMMLWKKGDPQHTPQTVPGFRVFPYMHMSNGHHHSTAYNFSLDSETLWYSISKIAFVEMPGCWSLRWTTDSVDSLEKSQTLLEIASFTNSEENASITCKNNENQTDGGGHEHHTH